MIPASFLIVPSGLPGPGLVRAPGSPPSGLARTLDLAGGDMSGVTQLVTSGPLILALPVAAAAGAVTFLSPCCLPLVPGYLSFVTGMAGAGGSPAVTAGTRPGRSARRRIAAAGRVRGGGRPRPAARRPTAARPLARPCPRRGPGRRRDGAVRARVLRRLRGLRRGPRRPRPPADRARPAADAGPGRADDRARAAVSPGSSTGSRSRAASSAPRRGRRRAWRERRCSA